MDRRTCARGAVTQCQYQERSEVFYFNAILRVQPEVLSIITRKDKRGTSELTSVATKGSLRRGHIHGSSKRHQRRVLSTTIQLVSRHNCGNASIRSITSTINIAGRKILQCFPDGSGLLTTICRRGCGAFNDIRSFVTSNLPNSKPSSFELPTCLEFLMRYGSAHPVLIRLFSVLRIRSFGPTRPLRSRFTGHQSSV